MYVNATQMYKQFVSQVWVLLMFILHFQLICQTFGSFVKLGSFMT